MFLRNIMKRKKRIITSLIKTGKRPEIFTRNKTIKPPKKSRRTEGKLMEAQMSAYRKE